MVGGWEEVEGRFKEDLNLTYGAVFDQNARMGCRVLTKLRGGL